MRNIWNKQDREVLSALKSLPPLRIIPTEANCKCCTRETFQSCVGDGPSTDVCPDSAACIQRRKYQYVHDPIRQN